MPRNSGYWLCLDFGPHHHVIILLLISKEAIHMIHETYLVLPLPKYRVRGISVIGWSATAVLLRFRMTACMVDAISNLDRIHPHKLLSIIKPFHLKLLLADRTEAIGQSWVIWDR